MVAPLVLRPGALTLDNLRAFMAGGQVVELTPEAWQAIGAAAETVRHAAGGTDPVYGVNTGFGSLARTRIDESDIAELQRRLVLSHMAGVGPLLPDAVVPLVLLLKINALARGHSGVRPELVERLIAIVNAGVLPCIPAQGSVGASGDLAPLAHLAAVVMGEGEARLGDMVLSGAEALRRCGIEAIALGAKEGLAFLNGTQVSTALAAAGLFATEDLFAAALVAGALSVDAVLGSDTPFDERIQNVRGQPGQIAVAASLRRLLAGSGIRSSHRHCQRVQDPYSIRCQPQVMGACLDVMRFAAGVIEREANGVSDNPLVFADQGELLSGGNFHGQPVAMAADTLALVLAEIGPISERRISLLTNPHMSELPALLVAEPGLNSGFMAAQISAAALASENKSHAHPASIDNIPTTADQEDHVSMATFAARRLLAMADNAAAIVAIELLAAAQGVDLRAPLKTSVPLQRAHRAIQERAPFLATDRPLAPDMAALTEVVKSGRFHEFVTLDRAM